jgi:hypothetical protein
MAEGSGFYLSFFLSMGVLCFEKHRPFRSGSALSALSRAAGQQRTCQHHNWTGCLFVLLLVCCAWVVGVQSAFTEHFVCVRSGANGQSEGKGTVLLRADACMALAFFPSCPSPLALTSPPLVCSLSLAIGQQGPSPSSFGGGREILSLSPAALCCCSSLLSTLLLLGAHQHGTGNGAQHKGHRRGDDNACQRALPYRHVERSKQQ